MSKKFKTPKYLDLDDLTFMLKYLCSGDRRPSWCQLNPLPQIISVVLFGGDSSDIPRIDIAMRIAHFNEEISIESLYDRFMHTLNDRQEIEKGDLKYIAHQGIEHLFSYSEYLRSRELLSENHFDSFMRPHRVTPYDIVGLDCEMVETTAGDEIGRISLVDENSQVIYDKFVRSEHKVIDYRTQFSGLTRENTEGGISHSEAVKEILEGFIGTNTTLIGHGLDNDLKYLNLYLEKIVDTSYVYLSSCGFKVNLGILCKKYLGYEIQKGEHDSIDDASCCIKLIQRRIKQVKSFLYGKREIFVSKDKRVQFKKCKTVEEVRNVSGYKIVLFEDDAKRIDFIPRRVENTQKKRKTNHITL